MISVLTKFVLATLAFAHGGGHGVKIEGLGPNGGRLAPVVLASEAELGERAATQAVAEWFREKNKLRFVVWDKERKKQLPLKAVMNKWILLGKSLPKPHVLSAGTELESASVKKAESVEIILPALGGKGEKHVVMIQLN